VLASANDEARLDAALNAIMASLREPCVIGGRLMDCHASIGATLFPRDGGTRTELMKNADVALYAAKKSGRCNFKLFRPDMRSEFQKRSVMLTTARDALSNDWIVPHYQPMVDLATRAITGFEALLRWHHPDHGLRHPDSIGAAFEDLALASDISDRMVERVIADMRRWLDQGTEFGFVSINAAAAEFRRGDFAERLLERLAKANVPTDRLHVEVTETVFLGRGAEFVERALKLLSANGIRIALDDFGTGYASLSHLKQFPVDFIKIDQSFVRDLLDDPGDAAIVDAVIKLGRSLGIGIVAEGIEILAQHATLSEMGCGTGQGFFYGKATPAACVPLILQPPGQAQRAA